MFRYTGNRKAAVHHASDGWPFVSVRSSALPRDAEVILKAERVSKVYSPGALSEAHSIAFRNSKGDLYARGLPKARANPAARPEKIATIVYFLRYGGIYHGEVF